ncbi:RNA methylase [Pluteus cervinus]|uniref:RNA methylase n=1 Tax=Pluteus cervinus TaxID=181527 RepID=A0ACD3ATX6_9AGAR|nr:RNA methylase [Pluteus cervinus]
MRYLVVFAQAHNDFRLPELCSVAELHAFTIDFYGTCDPTRPYMVLDLAEEAHAQILARRCILVKSVYEYYADGSSYDQLHELTRANRGQWEKYIPDTSFRFNVTAYNHKIPQSRQRCVVESFAYMGFLGKIDMKHPDIVLACFEEYLDRHETTRAKYDGDGDFIHLYFGKLLEEGSARSLISKFDVKKRAYFGNTSMEAEVSLLMANQSLASPGKFIYDPFMGTGSMAYPTAHFGAFVFGSDIDGRQMRGKGNPPGVLRAAAQYGIDSRIVDLCTFDVTNHPLRCGGLFDAIVTDPPYGVRAGAKRIGRKQELSPARMESYMEHRQNPQPDDQPYIPPTKPYELSSLVADLVLLARYLLKCGGRLVFFLPTVTEDYSELDVHQFLCEGMEVVGNSLQDFGSWGRRLITIKKVTDIQNAAPILHDRDSSASDLDHTPAHQHFRDKYFQGFKQRSA